MMSVIKGFFQDIRMFLSSKIVLAIDIGTISIKAMEIEREKSVLSLKNYGILQTKEYLKRANAALQTSSLKLSEEDVSSLLKLMLDEMKPKTKHAIVSLPTFNAFYVPIEMVLMSPEDTTKSIAFQARQYIPIPIDQVTIDWVKVGEFNSDTGQRFQRILMTGIPNTLIKKYEKIFKNIGLKLIALEVETNSIARALAKKGELPTLVVDIGAESTSVLVVHDGLVQEVGQTDYAGVTLTQALARSLNISTTRAEELKRRRGISDSKKEYELSTSLYPFLDVIIQECGRLKTSFEKRSGMKVRTLTLTGGGANLLGIEEYFKSQMGLPIQHPGVLDSFKHIPELDALRNTFDRDLAVASGLTFRFRV